MKLSDATPVHLIKLAALAVHAEEFLDTFRVNPPAAQFDEASMRSLLADPDVRGMLDDPANKVLLPEKRQGAIEMPDTVPHG